MSLHADYTADAKRDRLVETAHAALTELATLMRGDLQEADAWAAALAVKALRRPCVVEAMDRARLESFRA